MQSKSIQIMAENHQSKEDYCLECHWGSFRLDGKDDGTNGSQPQQPSSGQQEATAAAACSGTEHPDHDDHEGHALTMTTTNTTSSSSHCDGEEDCCEEDDCSTTCPSVCDGFVDCDDATACSVLHCDETHCENHCESPDPVCFDNHCFTKDDHAAADHGLESFLGLEQPFSLEANDLLPGLGLDQHQQQPPQPQQHPLQMHAQSKPEDQTGAVGLGLSHPTDASFFHPYSCPSHVPGHHGSLMHQHPTYPVQNDVNPADVFHMLGMCSDFSTCHMPEEQHCHSHPLNDSTNPFPCFHTEHGNTNTNTNNNNNTLQNAHLLHHHHHNSNDIHHNHLHQHQHQHQHSRQIKPPTSRPAKGPCRSHHRCRVHAHAHAHPYSAHSRQSRSSISSHLISSPGETPPPLDGGASSVITSPEFSPVDHDSFVCKWTTTSPSGMRTSCGGSFADAGALQKHLIACHMSTVDGAKGNGYYCCWEGCHRPDEPFSQKSKLQGHFLTHSNYKNFQCSVCGKVFARQATLDRHERSHRGDKPYRCTECGKSFTDSSELKTHSRTHTGEKPFKCTYPGCNFQTGDSSNMSSHRLTHGERRHKCHFPGCTKSFTRPDQLKRHLKSTHKDDASILSSSPGADQFTLSYGLIA